MARAQLANNASTTLAAGINNVVTALSVAAGTGAMFPVVSSYFYATIKEGANIEIVKVTARATDTFTIVRAQDGTTAKSFTAAATVSLNVTAAVLNEMQEAAAKDASGGYPGLTLLKLNLRNVAGTFTSFLTNTATAVRTWTMQDRDGTVAFTDDITGGALAGSFTTLSSTGNATLGDATTDTLNVGNGGLVKDAAGNVGIGSDPQAWGSTKRALEFGEAAGASVWASISGKSVNLGSNYYFDETQKIARATSESSEIVVTPTVLAMRHYASVTAGASIGSPDAHVTLTGAGLAMITPVGIGYGPGAGGTATQATSKATAVTLNKPCGVITMNNAALAAGAAVIFRLNNSLIALTDTVVCHHDGAAGTANAYVVQVLTTGVGSVDIRVVNISAGSLSEPLTLTFSTVKAVAA